MILNTVHARKRIFFLLQYCFAIKLKHLHTAALFNFRNAGKGLEKLRGYLVNSPKRLQHGVIRSFQIFRTFITVNILENAVSYLTFHTYIHIKNSSIYKHL